MQESWDEVKDSHEDVPGDNLLGGCCRISGELFLLPVLWVLSTWVRSLYSTELLNLVVICQLYRIGDLQIQSERFAMNLTKVIFPSRHFPCTFVWKGSALTVTAREKDPIISKSFGIDLKPTTSADSHFP